MEFGIIYIVLGFALGGILKGATGAGAPIIAVPIVASQYSVPLAVAIFIVPNLASNLWLGWSYRKYRLPLRFGAMFATAGAIGAGLGTVMLASLSGATLKVMVAIAVLAYIAFRLLRPNWVLEYEKSLRVVMPVGTVAGILQGASGISAPVSITFLNAMKLEREQFISTISVFFIAMALVQLPMLINYGFFTWETFWLSCAAVVPLVAFMPVGSFLAKKISRTAFDRAILALLAIVAIKLIVETLV